MDGGPERPGEQPRIIGRFPTGGLSDTDMFEKAVISGTRISRERSILGIEIAPAKHQGEESWIRKRTIKVGVAGRTQSAKRIGRDRKIAVGGRVCGNQGTRLFDGLREQSKPDGCDLGSKIREAPKMPCRCPVRYADAAGNRAKGQCFDAFLKKNFECCLDQSVAQRFGIFFDFRIHVDSVYSSQ